MSYGVQTAIMINIYKLENTYPIISWIIFYICVLVLLFVDFSILKMTKQDIIFIFFMIFWLIHLTIYKSSDWLIYPCITAYVLVFLIILYKYYSFKKEQMNKPTIETEKTLPKRLKKIKKQTNQPNNQIKKR